MSAVTVRGLERAYGATVALAGVDLDVGEGEKVAVLGANGAGKTTLVRVLAGLERPSAGTVEVLGRAPSDRAVRARVGLAGHASMLYPHLTALENLRLWAAVYAADERRCAPLLQRLGLDPDERRAVRGYSKGMRQRVSLARALVHAPELLLLDEPFAGLDEAGVAALTSMLAEHRGTLVLAAHSSDGTFGQTTRTVRLAAGRVAAPAG